LYLNPEIDTLWVVNYTLARARDERITDSVVFGRKIHKLAIPFETWNKLLDVDNYDEMAGFAVRFYDMHVKEVILVLEGEEFAEHSDVMFIGPREIPEHYTKAEWIQDVKNIYLPEGQGQLRWSICDLLPMGYLNPS
jgi:hypothetical protein